MIVETATGRRRSVVTDQELARDLKKRIDTLSDEERFFLNQALDQIRQMGENGEAGYESRQEMRGMAKNFRRYTRLHYESTPVSVKDFILSNHYMGHVGSWLYETWRNDLIELNSKPYNEIIFTGSIGCGKTSCADMGLAYMFYQLCMLRNPQETFGLMPGSEIVLVCFNRDQTLARDVTFGGFKRKIEGSPFFKELGLSIKRSIVEYKKKNIKVIPISARSANALGRDVFGGIIDEADFMEGSIIKEPGEAPGEKPFIEKLHESIMRRMKSRFDRAGVLPGKLFMTSSARHKGSYTNRRIGEVVNDSTVFCRDYALYEVIPESRYSKSRFWVRVGNERIKHKILSRKEYRTLGSRGRKRIEAEGCRFIRVPENYKPDFLRNIEDAIRDISGVVTVSVAPFFQLRSRIYEMIDPTLSSPITVTEWQTDKPLEIDWGRITKKYRRKVDVAQYVEEYGPARDPDAPRFVHMDLSLGVQDPAGLCIAHTVDYVRVERRGDDGHVFVEEAPLVEIDLVLRIVPPPGKEIDFGEIRGLIYDFQRHGFVFGHASMDSFQSRDMLQQLEAKGIPGKILSVEKIEPYTIFKTAVYENRVVSYDYPILTGEMEQLLRDEAKQKVIHPQTSTKDVSDAVCGVVCSLTTEHVFRSSMDIGINEYVGRRGDGDDTEWIRNTMERKGDKAPIEINDDDGPVFFSG